MKCKKCGYKWDSIKKNPVSCPRCKTRLDYPINKAGDKK